MEVFRERLREERKKAGYTQEDMGQKLNMTQSAYAQYETGKTQPSLETAIKIAEILKISLDYLVGRY